MTRDSTQAERISQLQLQFWVAGGIPVRADMRTKGLQRLVTLKTFGVGCRDFKSHPLHLGFFTFSDNDGIEDKFDNCLSQPNPDQMDTDLDGRGNN